MSKNTSVTLGEHFDNFVTKQIQSGRFGSVSEVIRTGLRVLKDVETKRTGVLGVLVGVLGRT